MRDEFEQPESGVTYIGPRSFVLGFAALCAVFGAVVYGAPRFVEAFDASPAPDGTTSLSASPALTVSPPPDVSPPPKVSPPLAARVAVPASGANAGSTSAAPRRAVIMAQAPVSPRPLAAATTPARTQQRSESRRIELGRAQTQAPATPRPTPVPGVSIAPDARVLHARITFVRPLVPAVPEADGVQPRRLPPPRAAARHLTTAQVPAKPAKPDTDPHATSALIVPFQASAVLTAANKPEPNVARASSILITSSPSLKSKL